VRLLFCGGRWVELSAEGRGGGALLSWWYERVCAVWEWRSIHVQVLFWLMNMLLILFYCWVNITIHAMKTQRLSYVSSKATHSSFLPSTAQYRHQLLQYRYQYHRLTDDGGNSSPPLNLSTHHQYNIDRRAPLWQRHDDTIT